MRAFVAVELDPASRAAAARLSDSLRRETGSRGLAFGRPETFHFTLKFLGEIAEVEAERLAAALAPRLMGIAPFELSLRGVGAFPQARRARVVWLGTGEGRETLISLARLVEHTAVELGHAGEERPYAPHLTLARVKDPSSSRVIAAWIAAHEEEELARLRVDAVTLYRSELRKEGAVHTPVARLALGGT